MTNEEMARILEAIERRCRGVQDDAISDTVKQRIERECVSLDAGAAALRARQWRPIEEAEGQSLTRCYGAHILLDGWIFRGPMSLGAAKARGLTHFVELPAPPKEGV